MASLLHIIGTSTEQGNMSLLERLTISPGDRPSLLPELKLKLGASELNYLATCNRVEITTINDDEIDIAVIRNRLLDFFLSQGRDFDFSPVDLYQFTAGDAVRRLFRVASSLESMIVGETQITGQFKDAFYECCQFGLVGEHLKRAMHQALITARRVRNETSIGQGALSMASLVIKALEHKMQLSEKTQVALVGSGVMSIKMGRYLEDAGVKNILFVNRTFEKARLLADKFCGKAISLDEFILNPRAIDVIVSATSANLSIFNSDFLTRLKSVNEQVTCVDLAIPRDFSREFASADFVNYVDILGLRSRKSDNLRKKFHELDKASGIIEQSVSEFLRSQLEKDLRPVMRKSLDESLRYAFEQCDILFSSKLKEESRDSIRTIKSLVRCIVGHSSAQFSKAVSEHLSKSQKNTDSSVPENQQQQDSSIKNKAQTLSGYPHA